MSHEVFQHKDAPHILIGIKAALFRQDGEEHAAGGAFIGRAARFRLI